MGKLAGKVAIVTGGTGALGRAFSRALANEGAKVVVTGRNRERGEETVALVRAAGGEATLENHDVTRADDWARVIQRTVEAFGRLLGANGDHLLRDLTLARVDGQLAGRNLEKLERDLNLRNDRAGS